MTRVIEAKFLCDPDMLFKVALVTTVYEVSYLLIEDLVDRALFGVLSVR